MKQSPLPPWHWPCLEYRREEARQMKPRGLVPMTLVAASLFLCSPDPVKAGVSVGVGVSFGSFHNSLAGYGTWSNHPTYGSVWAPSHVAAGWRPYTVGHWDDGYGQMTWVS